MENNMYHILIAEDEELERESLHAILLEYFKTSVSIKTAKNGIEALQLYKDHHPDVVLMDIDMPGLSGLEAIAKMKELNKESVYLILTSYNYFNYAQEAIRLGVEQFLLKPSNPQDIINMVSKALANIQILQKDKTQTSLLVEKYQDMHTQLVRQCIYTILRGANEFDIHKEFQRLGMRVKYGFCIVVSAQESVYPTFETLANDIRDVGYLCLYDFIDQRHVLYVLSINTIMKSDCEVIQYILLQHHMKDNPIGIGDIQEELDQLRVSYYQAVRNMHIYDACELLQIPLKGNVTLAPVPVDISSYANALVKNFMRDDEDKIHAILHKLSTVLLSKQRLEIEQIVNVIYEQVIKLLESELKQVIDRECLPLFSIREEQKYQNMEIEILLYFNQLFYPLSQSRSYHGNALVKKAMQYIRQNYQKPISLHDVAKHLQVTPFYVSKMLNQYNQKNFTDLVSELRIEEAKQLLKKQLRVKEVAYAVGFQSQNYFAKTFKKIVGISPSEYQDMFL